MHLRNTCLRIARRAAWACLLGLPLLSGGVDCARAGDSAANAHAAAAPSFKRAEGHRTWSFPRDHGQHPDYRLDWWYYTGIVRTAEGRPFGYQITFFREGVTPRPDRRGSAWRVGSVYLAHLAVSDLSGNEFHYTARTGRDSLNLSGAARDRQQVWIGSWKIEPLEAQRDAVHLIAQDKDLGIDLDLDTERPPVLHGVDGLDRKGPEPGQASWYYSEARLKTSGTLRLGEKSWRVQGTSWMDHEFGTSQLGNLRGWDWFSIRLDNGSDLMLYRLRNQDGTASAASSGTLVDAAGKVTKLIVRDNSDIPRRTGQPIVILGSHGFWTSPRSQAQYPLEWSVRSPELGMDLSVKPAAQSQELLPGLGLPFGYWEGATWVEGLYAGRSVKGEGYMELTGYSGDLGEAFR